MELLPELTQSTLKEHAEYLQLIKSQKRINYFVWETPYCKELEGLNQNGKH